ncbi:MAG: hypothetical protein HY236_13600 [Acidobacteria bacterium]|nr:hypothetical protein [Acidobacteriota bacterium]
MTSSISPIENNTLLINCAFHEVPNESLERALPGPTAEHPEWPFEMRLPNVLEDDLVREVAQQAAQRRTAQSLSRSFFNRIIHRGA